MATTNKSGVVKAILQYTVDQNGVTQVIAANAKVKAALVNTTDVLGSIGKFNTSAAVKQTDNLTAAQKRLRDAFREAGKSQAFADPSTNSGFLNALSNAKTSPLGRVGSELRMLPSIQIPGAGIGTDAVANVIRLGGAIDSLGIGLGTVFGVIAVGLPIVLAISAAIGAYNNDLQANIEKVKLFSDALNEAFGAGTTNAIQKLRQQAVTDQENANAQLGILKAQQANAPDQAAVTTTNILGDIGNAGINISNTFKQIEDSLYGTKTALTPQIDDVVVRSAESYNEATKAQQKIVDDAAIAIEGYDVALGNTRTTSANTAKLIDDLSGAQYDAAKFAAKATTDSVNERIAAYQQEIQFLTGESSVLAAQGTDAANAIKQEVDARIELLKLQKDATEAIREEVAAREAANAALELANRMSKAAGEFVTKNSGDISKLQLDGEKAKTSHEQELVKLEAAAQRDQEKIVGEGIKKQNAILADANEKTGELADQYGIDRLRAAEDLQKELKKLARGEGQTIAERDAAGLVRVKQQEDDEKEQADTRETRREEDYDRELQQLAKATDKQLRQQEAATDKALREQIAAANDQLSIENQKYIAESSMRQQALDYALAQYRQFIADLKNVPGSSSVNGSPINTVNIGTANATQAQAAANFAAYQRSQGVPGFAGGGTAYGLSRINERGVESGRGINSGRFMVFSEPTQVYTAQQTRAMIGGARYTLNMSFQGLQTKTVEATSKAHARRVVNTFIEAL